MAAANAPIAMREALTLTSLGIAPQFITFTNVTMESDRYICVRETEAQGGSLVMIDMAMPSQPLRRPITADSALMNPNTRILALKAQIPGTMQDHMQIFNIEAKTKIKVYQMPEKVVFWKWITPKLLGLVTQESVYHWSIEGDSKPIEMFVRTTNLVKNVIVNYRCDPSEKWLVLIGIAPGAPKRPQLLKGNMQIFSVDQQRTQALEAHAAAFATFKVPGNENPSTLICFASTAFNAGTITSKLHIIELGDQPGKACFSKKQADLFFPPDLQDDFPVGIQISQKYGLVYVIMKLGWLFVYDLETAAAVYSNRISPDPIFLTAESSTTGGFYAINRRGQVLHATVNDATVVPLVSWPCLNNLELDVNLAKRANLPGAENLSYEDGEYGQSSESISTLLSSLEINDQATELKTLEEILIDANAKPARLSYPFIRSITGNFSQEIGRGGFGVVYLGHLGIGKVAVKKLSISQGFSDKLFVDEINCLIGTRHSNIVRLLGYCADTHGEFVPFNQSHVLAEVPQRMLCFEYVPNGNLQTYLKDKSHKDDWKTKYQMIRGICHGLNYLHNHRITHLDLKPDNILLDARLEPKITDFGISRCFDAGISRVYTKNICGTPGIIAPEIIDSGEITFKSDMYGLGIIIIKILTGCNNYDFENWHTSIDVDGLQVQRCIEMGQKCVSFNQRERPTIGEIMQKLDEIERP